MPDISDMYDDHLDLFRLDSAFDMQLGAANFEARPAAPRSRDAFLTQSLRDGCQKSRIYSIREGHH